MEAGVAARASRWLGKRSDFWKMAGKTKAFRLNKFDKTVLDLVYRGEYSLSRMRDFLHVDAKDFDKRAKTLVRQKFLIVDASNPDFVRLSVKGFNKFSPTKPRKKRAEEKKPAVVAGVVSAPGSSKDLKQFLTTSEKGSTKQPSFFVQRQQSGAQTPLPSASHKPFSRKKESEACELCKAGFSLSVNKKSNPKYGHCFCGAAYHKDCYETLSSDNGTCARCGRKLELILDKRSEEAVKGIKDVFD